MPTKIKKQHKKSTEPSFLSIFGVILCVAVLTFVGLVLYHEANKKPTQQDSEPGNINTAEVKVDSNESEQSSDVKDIKDLIEEENQKPEVEIAENGLKIPSFDVSVRQNNGMTIISGKVTNFIETGGSCTYTLSGPAVKSYTKEVLPDPKYTVCDALIIKSGELANGSWQVKVEYKSQTAGGISEAQTFTIQ